MVIGRYLGVGLASAALNNVIMIAGDLAGWHYVTSSLVSLVIVTVFGYQLHSRWTFPDSERTWKSFARYAVTVSMNLPLALAGLFVLIDLLGFSVPIAALIVTVLLFAFNWIANRWALRAHRGRPYGSL